MGTKFFKDISGNYIGGFDGALPPDGSIEVPEPPPHALRYIHVNGAWEKQADADKDRDQAYEEAGFTLEAIKTALWESVAEGNNDSLIALKLKKDAVDAALPK